MLARDEAERLPAAARLLADLYDDWVLLIDDRTTDDTELVARASLEGPGRVERFEFRDFASARNRLFAAARPGADYLLLADPDSPPSGTLPEPLDAASYSCSWWNGVDEWHLPILVRADAACRYEGAVHELLVGVSPVWTPDLRVEVKPKPARPERAAEFIELLRPAAERGEPRAAFYLARTLKDAGRRGEAIEWYLRRAQMGDAGWVEETFICLLDAGVLLLPLDVELARTLLRRAHKYRPSRIEPLYHLAWLSNWEGCAECAARIALQGVQTPRSTDALFVNRWAERHGLVEELNKARAALGAEPSTMERNGEPLRS